MVDLSQDLERNYPPCVEDVPRYALFESRKKLFRPQIYQGLCFLIAEREKKSKEHNEEPGAFDNVSHSAILHSLNNSDGGPRAYSYIGDFLTDSAATVGLANLGTVKPSVPPKDTPECS
ncbi:hypothetical protein HPB50_019141 [Hyalomma asiaticum]|uniref:Uncharacterized protein n=1 Tax=Hyalomma asiaticum TaxID=266040 RepID=A0ACB7SJJ6_HYAAI|nr:hypothetical protein HPB50_019141 [Hyalomma asiaticum]